jgi:methionyl-tRNA formyltransferase
MRIVTLCATQRGYRFIEKLAELVPESELVVFSFREEPWEPPYLDDIRKLTLAKGGQFFETRRVGSSKWVQFWESSPMDLLFAVSWRFMVPTSVYDRARLGAFVFHDSMLPEYRGFSPTVWSIINGEDHTGVTLFEIAEGVDEGDIIAQKRVPIGPDDPIAVVLERVTQTYLDLLEQNLGSLINRNAPRHPQDHSRATYTSKRLPEDNQIEWTASTKSIYNLIRAVSAPYPGAFTYLLGEEIRIWSAIRMSANRNYVGRVAGRIVEVRPGEGSVVLTGDGSLLLTKLQMEGGEVTCAANILKSLSQTLGR